MAGYYHIVFNKLLFANPLFKICSAFIVKFFKGLPTGFIMKKISIKDIAEHLNISKTTVSFVLNGRGEEYHISKKLEERILDYMQQVNYQPNEFAQGLKTGKTKMIGMLVEDISDPFFAKIARMIEEAAYKKGYKIIYSSTDNNTQKTKEMIQVYRARRVDGYIIAPPPGIEMDIQALIDARIPVVLFDRVSNGIPSDSVMINNLESTHNAVLHLIDNGYKNIALISLNSNQNQMTDRLHGYKQAMNDGGLPHIILQVAYPTHRQLCVHEIQGFISANKHIDAVFFATNYIAGNGLEAIRNLKLSIPGNIAVVVFDDQNFFRISTPSVSAISQPIKQISETVIDMMLMRLSEKGKPGKPLSVVLPATLNIRDSSQKRKD